MDARSSAARSLHRAHPRSQPPRPHARPSTLVTSTQFTAHSRFAIALGVSAACAARDPRWSRVVAALCALCRALGWRVRSASLSVGSTQSTALVERACDAIGSLVDLRESEPELAPRAAAVRTAIDAVRSSIDSL